MPPAQTSDTRLRCIENVLRHVLAEYEAMRARPMIARVRCELGRLVGDDSLIESGLRLLRELDDQLQLARFGG